MIPVHPGDRHLLAVQWAGQTFFDTRLPFGLRSAPKICSAVADALQWCMRNQGVTWVSHYLDDYITMGPPHSPICQHNLDQMLAICRRLGVPVAPAKCEGPATVLVFLGFELDTINMVVRLPQAKLQRTLALVREWVGKKSCRKRELESLLGHLQHAATVIRPGSTFVRRLIELVAVFQKGDHYVRINKSTRSDILWWSMFMEDWNGVSLMPSVVQESVPLEQKLIGMVAFVVNQGLKHQTIKCYLSAVRHLQISCGGGDPRVESMPLLELMLRGSRKEQSGIPKRTRLPITPSILEQLRRVWNRDSSDRDNIMLWAVCCVGFFGFFRSGELTAPEDGEFDPEQHLTMEDITLDNPADPQRVSVRLKQSKTDPFRLGVTIHLGKTNTLLCPVAALLSYLVVQGKQGGPLFQFRDGRALTRSRLVLELRKALSSARRIMRDTVSEKGLLQQRPRVECRWS